MEVNVASLVSPAFDDAFWDIQEHGHTFYWFAGGRGSTKSSFVGVDIPLLLMQHPQCHAVVPKYAIPSKTACTRKSNGALNGLV